MMGLMLDVVHAKQTRGVITGKDASTQFPPRPFGGVSIMPDGDPRPPGRSAADASLASWLAVADRTPGEGSSVGPLSGASSGGTLRRLAPAEPVPPVDPPIDEVRPGAVDAEVGRERVELARTEPLAIGRDDR